MFTKYSDGKTLNKTDGVYKVQYNDIESLSGQDVSIAYEQLYQIYGAGCYNCSEKYMQHVKVDGKSYSSQFATSPGDNQLVIEPVTGVMTSMKRSYTMVLSLYCYENGVQFCSNYVQLPFPSLDQFKDMQLPVFSVTEEIIIDNDKFIDSVSYITNAHARIVSWSFALAMASLSTCLLAGLFWFIYWMNEPVKQQQVNARVKQLEQIENQTESIKESTEIKRPFFFL